MPKQRTTEHPWTLRLLSVLDDGEWHDYGDVVKQAGMEVPEQMAFDKAEYYREYHYRRRGLEPSPRRYGDREDTVRTGQRFIISKTVNLLLKNGKVEVLYENNERLRKRPSKIRISG